MWFTFEERRIGSVLLEVDDNTGLYFGDERLEALIEHSLRRDEIRAAAGHFAHAVYGRVQRIRNERVHDGLLVGRRAHVQRDEKETLIPAERLHGQLAAERRVLQRQVQLLVCARRVHELAAVGDENDQRRLEIERASTLFSF